MLGILPQFHKFLVVDGTPLGKAVIAKEDIAENEIICKFAGPRINLKQFFEKYDANGCNVLQIDDDTFMDVIEPYVYFNHSCSPNAGMRNNGILFALDKIKKGEEISFDYSTTADDVIWSMECRCEAKNCRKIIGDFQSIPHERKEYYLGKNALLGFIKRIYY